MIYNDDLVHKGQLAILTFLSSMVCVGVGDNLVP